MEEIFDQDIKDRSTLMSLKKHLRIGRGICWAVWLVGAVTTIGFFIYYPFVKQMTVAEQLNIVAPSAVRLVLVLATYRWPFYAFGGFLLSWGYATLRQIFITFFESGQISSVTSLKTSVFILFDILLVVYIVFFTIKARQYDQLKKQMGHA